MTAFAAGLLEPKRLPGTSRMAPNASYELGPIHALSTMPAALRAY